MVIQIHFEKLSSGMKVKLETRYRDQNNYFHNIRKSYGNGFSSGLLGDALEKRRLGLIGRNS